MLLASLPSPTCGVTSLISRRRKTMMTRAHGHCSHLGYCFLHLHPPSFTLHTSTLLTLHISTFLPSPFTPPPSFPHLHTSTFLPLPFTPPPSFPHLHTSTLLPSPFTPPPSFPHPSHLHPPSLTLHILRQTTASLDLPGRNVLGDMTISFSKESSLIPHTTGPQEKTPGEVRYWKE